MGAFEALCLNGLLYIEEEIYSLRFLLYGYGRIPRQIACKPFEFKFAPMDKEPLCPEFHDEPLGIVQPEISDHQEASRREEAVELMDEPIGCPVGKVVEQPCRIDNVDPGIEISSIALFNDEPLDIILFEAHIDPGIVLDYRRDAGLGVL